MPLRSAVYSALSAARPQRLTLASGSLLLASALSAMPANALQLKASTVKLEHPANGSVLRLPGQPVLLVSGHNHEHRWLSRIDYANNSTEQIALPEQVQFFQPATLAGQTGSQLVAMGQDALWHYQSDSKKWRQLASAPSAYPVTDAKRMLQLEFTADLDQNGLTDFLVPDFRALQVLMQQKDGTFRTYALPITAQMQIFEKDPDFFLKTPRQVDYTLDGRTDIVFNVDDNLWVYPQ